MEQNHVTVTLCYPHWFRAQDITVQDSRVHARPFMELRRHISSEVLSQLVYVADLSGWRSSTPALPVSYTHLTLPTIYSV